MPTQKVTSFEWGRVLALFAIVVLHAGAFRGDAFSQSMNVFGDYLNQACRFGVPLFFIMAGYFIQPRLTNEPGQTFSKYSQPLLKVWLVWSVIYLLSPFDFWKVATEGYMAERTGYWDYLLSHPLNSLFEGGMVHLWYIPGLLCALGIITLLLKYNKAELLVPLALGLYVWGLGAGSYKPLLEGAAPIFTRNGPFFSLLMVTAGFEIRRRNISFGNLTATAMMLGGFALHLAEGAYLTKYDTWMATHDFLIGTPIWTIGIFMLLKNFPNLGDSRVTRFLSRHVLGVYLCHMIVLISLFNIFGMLQIGGWTKDLLVAPLTLVISYLLIAGIEKTPLSRLFLRDTFIPKQPGLKEKRG